MHEACKCLDDAEATKKVHDKQIGSENYAETRRAEPHPLGVCRLVYLPFAISRSRSYLPMTCVVLVVSLLWIEDLWFKDVRVELRCLVSISLFVQIHIFTRYLRCWGDGRAATPRACLIRSCVWEPIISHTEGTYPGEKLNWTTTPLLSVGKPGEEVKRAPPPEGSSTPALTQIDRC